MKKLIMGVLACTFLSGAAHAASFGVEADKITQKSTVENGLALAIDDSRASVGLNYACGVKAKEIKQTAKVKNGLALAIDDSSAHVGSNVVGDGRCW